MPKVLRVFCDQLVKIEPGLMQREPFFGDSRVVEQIMDKICETIDLEVQSPDEFGAAVSPGLFSGFQE